MKLGVLLGIAYVASYRVAVVSVTPDGMAEINDAFVPPMQHSYLPKALENFYAPLMHAYIGWGRWRMNRDEDSPFATDPNAWSNEDEDLISKLLSFQ